MGTIKEPDGPFYIFSKPLTPEENADLVEYIANYKREEIAKAVNKTRTTTAERQMTAELKLSHVR